VAVVELVLLELLIQAVAVAVLLLMVDMLAVQEYFFLLYLLQAIQELTQEVQL
jgi:hypothetical protein